MSKCEEVISVITKIAITHARGKQAQYQTTISSLLTDSEINPDGIEAKDLILAHKKDNEHHEVFMRLREHMANTITLGKNSNALFNNYINLSLERIAYNVPTNMQKTAV